MMRTATWICLLCVPLMAACQELDNEAASASSGTEPDAAAALDTPPIELPDGETTTDACVATTQQATDILTTNCSGCHGGGTAGARQGQPPFDYVLDFNKLKTARSATVPDPIDADMGMRFVRPGDPENSRVWVRISVGEMPPELPIGVDPIPRPTISDASLLYTWILDCLEE
jgi:cytochrome c553